MDCKIKSKNDISFLYKEEKIKSINKFFNSHNIKIDIKDSDIKIIDKFLNNKTTLNIFIFQKEINGKKNYIKYILKKNCIKLKKHISLNNNKYFLLLIYIYILNINNIQNDKSNIEEKEQYTIAFKNIFIILINLYKNDFLSFHSIFLFFELYFELIKNKKILSNENIDIIILIINFVKKIVRISNIYKLKKFIEKEEEKKLINEDIYNLFEKIFIMNNNNIIFSLNLLRNPKILALIKICFDYYNNNIIEEKNKNFIKNNLVKLFLNRFNYMHLDYFYDLSKKYLLNLDNTIDNSNLDEKSGMKTSPIIYNNKFDLGLTIIFSFKSIKNDNLNNNSQVILSLNNAENNNYIFKLSLINNDLYYYTQYNKKKNLLMENIKNNYFNLCFIYYDQSMLYFFINKEHKFFDEQNILKDINNIYFELGFSNDNNEKFNGIIGPILFFNSIINNQFDVFLQVGKCLKGQYYLTAEQFKENNLDIKEKNVDNKEKKIYFSYEEYYGLFNKDIDKLNNVKNSLGNVLLYINPEVVLNNLNFYEINKFNDYQTDNKNESNNNKKKNQKNNISNNNIYYSFNADNNISNYVYKEENLLKFFINNHGFNYIILNIESIYNYLIILNDDKLEKIDFSIM